MPEVPDDLIKLSEVLKQYKPSRTWWDTQFANGVITPYKMPGERGLLVSKRAVEELMQPRPYVKGEADESAG
jgi:hypothetical protein